MKKAIQLLSNLSTEKFHLPLLGMFIGFSVYFSCFGYKFLNPFFIDWIMYGDPAQHFIGWHFFRSEPWGIPLGKIQSYLFPDGTSIVYTDSIPLMAILLKPFSSVLPDVFQYQGIWVLLSYTLQGLFASLLLGKVSKAPLPILLGTFFFSLSPIMWLRTEGHESLTSHWVILASLYLYLSQDTIRTRIMWRILLLLTSMIHFYLLVMILIIWGGYLLRELLKNFKYNVVPMIWTFTTTLFLLITVMWFAGYFVIDASSSVASGYGDCSMNLIAPFNPPLSTFFMKKISLSSGCQSFEGFNYFGFGLLLMILASLYVVFFQKNVFDLTRDLPLLIVTLTFLILALSNKVMIANKVIFYFELPDLLSNLLNVVRSSGRFFWPVAYILTVASIAILVKYNRIKTAVIYILIALIFQFVELWPIYKKYSLIRHTLVRKSPWSYPLKSSLWDKLASEYDHLILIPPFTDNDDYLPFALLAASHGKTINVGHVAHQSLNKTKMKMEELLQKLKEGYISKDSLYVFLEKELFHKPSSSADALIGILDGYLIMVPGFKTSSKDVQPWPCSL